MRKLIVWTFSLALLGSTAFAGSIADPVPTNPCPGATVFRAKLAVLDVSSDGAALCGGIVNADTAITCTIKEPDSGGVGADVVIEYYDETGAPMNSPLGVALDTFCGALPGDTLTFTLSVLPPGPAGFGPWATGPPVPGFVGAAAGSCGPGCALHGYARVFSTDKKIQCTGTRIDTSGFCLGAAPTPLTTKNLTVITVPRQKGD
jgi:hypothetical protein